ncbi:MAG: MFS transporter, partial [Euryarchaeota archaeon]|nr:MFS transporter [Euryarchaeota archaeon]
MARGISIDHHREVAIYAVLIFVAMLNLTLMAPCIKEFIIDRFGASNTEASMFFTLEMLAYVIFAVAWGSLSDKCGKRKPFIVFGFGGSAVLYFLMAQANSLSLLLILRFIQGAITVMAWSLVMTSALDCVQRTSYGKTMGVIGMAMMLGMASGAPIGGLLAEKYDVFFPMYFASFLFLTGTLLSAVLIREVRIENNPDTMRESIKVLSEERKLAIPYVFSFVDRFTVAFFILAFPLYLFDAFGFSIAERGLYQALLLFPFILLQYPFGKLSDKIGRTLPLIIGSFFYGLEMCLVGFVGRTTLIALMLCCGVFAAMMFPSTIALAGDISPRNKRGTAIGGFNVFGSLGFVAGFSAAGILSDMYGYCTSFIL